MKEHKIFKPTLLLQNYISSGWSENIRTIDSNKIPVNQFLKNKGIWAIEIEPLPDKSSWYAFSLPINKDWVPQTIQENTKLSFYIYNESSVSLNIEFEFADLKKSNRISKEVNETGEWNEVLIDVPVGKIRQILFSGATSTPLYVIKDIVLK